LHEHFCYKIPASLAPALSPYEGKKAVLGIRPEFIALSPDMKKTEGYLCDTVIDIAEPQGSYSILIAHIGGEEVKIVSSDLMEIGVNTGVSLNVKDEQVMFFDSSTGLRIR
jgi:ABC-type sugar transport system ATPase subunit